VQRRRQEPTGDVPVNVGACDGLSARVNMALSRLCCGGIACVGVVGCMGSSAKDQYFGVLGRRSFPQRRGGLHHRRTQAHPRRLDRRSNCQTAANRLRLHLLLLSNRYRRRSRLHLTPRPRRYPAGLSLPASTHTANSPQSAKSTNTATVAHNTPQRFRARLRMVVTSGARA
jgi:hypothetical protein